MKQQEVFKKIGTILSELNDQYEYLGKTDDQLSDLELELFVSNAHFLAEHSEILRKLNLQNMPPPVAEKQPEPPEQRYFEPVIQAKTEANTEITATPAPPIDLAANGADDDFSHRKEEPEVIKHELIIDESEIWEDEDDTGFVIDEVTETESVEIPPPPVPEPVKEPEPEREAPVVEVKELTQPVEVKKETRQVEVRTETVIEETLTINQRISAQMQKSGNPLGEQIHAQPITDLKQSITLNDKLLYIKDLFNGYNLAYSEAIDIINRFNSFEEAEDFLQSSYAAKNHWESKQATVDKFYALLRRRYS